MLDLLQELKKFFSYYQNAQHRWAHIDSKNNSVLPMLLSANENSEHESNPISWSVKTYLSGSTFVACFAPNCNNCPNL